MKIHPILSIASAVVFSAAPSMPAQAALVTNGDFSNGLTGWTASGNVHVAALPYYGMTSGTNGTKVAVFNGGDSRPKGDLWQTIATLAGGVNRLTFSYAVISNGNQSIAASAADAGSALVLATNSFATTSTALRIAMLDFVARSTSTVIRFANIATNNTISQDLGFTNVAVAAIPEPSTWALMLVGFGLVGAATRYRRRSVAARFA